ncbi:MAG TPA: exodeoxyribonuclease VII large subunit [Gemmataceae bacterium]|nr:exodeoxyribonuclease VII large subunit [Gemmataceae bacterium]
MTTSFVPEGVKVLSVSELTSEVKGVLEEAFPAVWVAGEVSNLKKHTSGHWYLTLKDAESQLGAVIYRGVNLRLRFDLRNGMKVIAFGRLMIYAPQGVYQLQVEKVQPEGIGPLELALRQRKEKLFRLGYFDPKRKKRLPRFPRRVVLVTSPTGAAVRDMLEVLGRRWPLAEVWVCPVPVQGDGAAEQIAEAIHRLNRMRGLDVMIIGRGGGSLEDLWEFNEECVAQAIFQSRIPVVTGIGHETDVTIADLVADCRALTPTQAASLVAPDRQEIAQDLADREARLRAAIIRRLEVARTRLNDLARRRSFRRPLERVREGEQRLDEWAERLWRAGRLRLERARQKLEATAARLESLSPLNVLGRGYSLTRMESDRSVVRSAAQVRPGDRLLTLLHSGSVVSRVEEVRDGETTRTASLNREPPSPLPLSPAAGERGKDAPLFPAMGEREKDAPFSPGRRDNDAPFSPGGRDNDVPLSPHGGEGLGVRGSRTGWRLAAQ